MIRRAAPVMINGTEFRADRLATEIAKSRDYLQNMDSDLRADPQYRPHRTEVRKQISRIKQLEPAERLAKAITALRSGQISNLRAILPLLLSIKGDPYHLDNHFPFEPFFSTLLARRIVLKTGRQVSKSTSLAAQGVVKSNTIPFFNTLYVTPLYEMIRRFSTNYVRGFIDQSPVRSLLIDTSCNKSVLQRSFRNNSTMFFSFAFLDADRTRGLNNDKTAYDEVQDMDRAFIPIIRETMSGSKWGFEQFTGTPKTMEGCLQSLWEDSTQAEWHIWCKACGHENIPSLAHDLDAMTGPSRVNREISERYPGVVCAKCGRPVYPRTGRWIHHEIGKPLDELSQDELPARLDFTGYHVPQHIMPMHYADPEKWGVLLGKRDGYGQTPPHVYYNEVCGESFDQGAKIVTKTELKAACTSRPNDINYAASIAGDYVERVVSIDWGGGGEKETSFTVVTVLGMRADGVIEVLFGHRFRTMHDYPKEASAILHIMRKCRCTHVVHDFGGQGSLREHLMVTAGLPLHQIIPVSYVRASSSSIMKEKPENERTGQRMYYTMDKTRSLMQTCELIRYRRLLFFQYDHRGSTQQGLINDFLTLVEDTVDSRTGTPITTIIKAGNSKSGKKASTGPDDFAQAVNIGVTSLFYMRGEWPDLAAVAKIKIDPKVLAQMSPPQPTWDEI